MRKSLNLYFFPSRNLWSSWEDVKNLTSPPLPPFKANIPRVIRLSFVKSVQVGVVREGKHQRKTDVLVILKGD